MLQMTEMNQIAYLKKNTDVGLCAHARTCRHMPHTHHSRITQKGNEGGGEGETSIVIFHLIVISSLSSKKNPHIPYIVQNLINAKFVDYHTAQRNTYALRRNFFSLKFFSLSFVQWGHGTVKCFYSINDPEESKRLGSQSCFMHKNRVLR